MDRPMELPLYYASERAGTLRVEKNGLYYCFSASSSIKSPQVLRVYCVNGFQVAPVGVLMPAGERLALREKISVRSWPLEEIQGALAAKKPSGAALPWCGSIDGVEIRQAWIEQLEDGYALYLPDQQPFPLPAQLQQAEPASLDGQPVLRLMLRPDGSIDRKTPDTQDNAAQEADTGTQSEAVESSPQEPQARQTDAAAQEDLAPQTDAAE